MSERPVICSIKIIDGYEATDASEIVVPDALAFYNFYTINEKNWLVSMSECRLARTAW